MEGRDSIYIHIYICTVALSLSLLINVYNGWFNDDIMDGSMMIYGWFNDDIRSPSSKYIYIYIYIHTDIGINQGKCWYHVDTLEIYWGYLGIIEKKCGSHVARFVT